MEIAILAQESGAMAWIRRSVAVGAVILMFPLRRVLKAQAAGSRGADAAHLGPAVASSRRLTASDTALAHLEVVDVRTFGARGDGKAVDTLVERFDIEPFSDFSVK